MAGGRDSAVDGLVKVELDVSLAEVATGTALRLVADINVLGKLGALGHTVMMMLATASRCVKREAPSIAP